MPFRRPKPTADPLLPTAKAPERKEITGEELRELLDLALEGRTVVAVARLTGRRPHGVKCLLWKVKLRYEDGGRQSLVDKVRGVRSRLNPNRTPTLIDHEFASACRAVDEKVRLSPDDVRELLGLSAARMAVMVPAAPRVRRTLI